MRTDQGNDRAAAHARRILLVADHFPTIPQTFVTDLAVDLMEAGDVVEVLSCGGDPSIALDVRHHVIEPSSPSSPSWFERRRQRRRLLAAASPKRRTALRRLLRVRDRRTWRLPDVALAAALPEDADFDVVHAHFGVAGVRASRLLEAGLLSGVFVVSFHGPDATRPLSRRALRKYARMFDRADLVTAPSHFLADLIADLGCPRDRLAVKRCGVDLGRFPFTERSLPADGEIRLLTVARLEEQKGHAVAIEALARLVPHRPLLRYLIVGEGSERARLEAQIERLGLGQHVSLLGARPHADVPAVLADAHVYLQPSRRARAGNRDALAISVLEAQASGLPVLAGRVGGIPEAVQADALVAPGDPAAWAKQLDALLSSPDTWARRGRDGRAFVEAHFDQREIVRRWRADYARLARSRR